MENREKGTRRLQLPSFFKKFWPPELLLFNRDFLHLSDGVDRGQPVYKELAELVVLPIGNKILVVEGKSFSVFNELCSSFISEVILQDIRPSYKSSLVVVEAVAFKSKGASTSLASCGGFGVRSFLLGEAVDGDVVGSLGSFKDSNTVLEVVNLILEVAYFAMESVEHGHDVLLERGSKVWLTCGRLAVYGKSSSRVDGDTVRLWLHCLVDKVFDAQRRGRREERRPGRFVVVGRGGAHSGSDDDGSDGVWDW